jgi:acyl carrier protein
MDEIALRLARCFSAVFPELSKEEILSARSSTVRSWDSVAGVTLLAVVEEEFEIPIEVDDLSRFNSFDSFLYYLRESRRDVNTSGEYDK